jgi:hypothetical protein
MRGTAAGERVVSQAQTRAFDKGYEQSNLGKRKQSRERGKWILDPRTGKLVRPWEYQGGQAELAKDAPIVSGRFYEETAPSPIDGSEINSKRKYQEHMRRNGVTHASDYKGAWARSAKEREDAHKAGLDFAQGKGFKPTGYDQKGIHEAIGRAIYDLENKGRK